MDETIRSETILIKSKSVETTENGLPKSLASTEAERDFTGFTCLLVNSPRLTLIDSLRILLTSSNNYISIESDDNEIQITDKTQGKQKCLDHIYLDENND